MAQSVSRAAAGAQPAKDRSTLYEEITNKIITELEAGRLPWVQPWGAPGVRAPLGMPKNAATGRAYSGINVLILWGAVVEHGTQVRSIGPEDHKQQLVGRSMKRGSLASGWRPRCRWCTPQSLSIRSLSREPEFEPDI